MNKTDVQAVFDIALAKAEEASAAAETMAEVMHCAIQNLLPSGTILELNRRPLPEYLTCVRTINGNDRGTRTFRVVQVTGVGANPLHPDLSKWICEAVPISEKTGRDMRGSTHGADSRSTVRLCGYFGNIGLDEPEQKMLDRLTGWIAKIAGDGVASSDGGRPPDRDRPTSPHS